MPINFFSFLNEIRNKIYKKALVLSELTILYTIQYNKIYKLILPRNN